MLDGCGGVAEGIGDESRFDGASSPVWFEVGVKRSVAWRLLRAEAEDDPS